MNKGVKYTLVIKDFEQYKEGYNITPKYDRDTRELPTRELDFKVVGKDDADIRLICDHHSSKCGGLEYKVSPSIDTTEKPGVRAYERH